MNCKKFFNAYTTSLLILGIIFFFIYSYFSLTIWLPNYNELGHIIYSWPDAMANQAFINHFVESGSFVIEQPLNQVVSEIIHPRSVNVFAGNLVPMSFLGMLLIYGVIAKLLSIKVLFFLTPFFSVVAVWFFYGLVKRVFQKKAAFISSLLLFSMAVYWYYSTLVMLHTVLFISLLIIGLWFLTYKHKNKYRQYAFIGFGAFLIGLSLTVRTVEAPWILLICLILFLFFGLKKWYWKILVFIVCFVLAFMPVLWQNNILYGETLSLGYLKMHKTGDQLARLPNEFQVDAINPAVKLAQMVIVPFGFHPKVLLINFYKYFLKFYYPYLILALAGAFMFYFSKKKTPKQKAYLTIVLSCSAWLFFYYGNWVLADSDVLKYNSIGGSYMRYWLPIYIMILPAGGYFLARLFELKISKKLITFFVAVVICGLSFYSYTWAVKAPRDGLEILHENIESYYSRYNLAKQYLPDDAIVITDRTDKIFFPKYDVVVFLFDNKIFSQLEKIIDQQPIYYFTTRQDDDMKLLEEEVLTELQLQFVEPQRVDKNYRLFKLAKIE